ncbi:MAG TPA: ABC transporter ATP-binding protein [Candidatus Agrococcus pullicola]|uniref:ABC transporter ATP-binding protein n=1 Tax=Candidatus Agrococcus pullicola TaxID=2838429 RepID=A0A9D1YY03_9MICO|nr:ABC transporter ATP-binding protein [Candidatus Agrococcus pullicola]
MTTVIQTKNVSKRYKAVAAVDELSVEFEQHRIHGLLGRNGAGKTTLMQLLTGQLFATGGQISVFGEEPVENADVLRRVCFIQEGQVYPDGFTPEHVLTVARGIHSGWDEETARHLVDVFELPTDRKIKKLSRGQLSAIGIIVGIASRAELTFFDEPYLGLDAVARKNFYDELLRDFSEHPRTIVISSHHIDEIAPLLETVTVIDNGKLLMRHEVEELADAASSFSGTRTAIDEFAEYVEVLERTDVGGLSTIVVRGQVPRPLLERASELKLERQPASLQDLFVALTESARQERRARQNA